MHRRSGDITDACVRELRGFGVDTSRIVTGDGRFGVYYVEGGANQLPSRVIYDRAWSAIAMAKPGDIDWDKNNHRLRQWLCFTILSIRRFLPLPRSTGSGMYVSPGRSA